MKWTRKLVIERLTKTGPFVPNGPQASRISKYMNGFRDEIDYGLLDPWEKEFVNRLEKLEAMDAKDKSGLVIVLLKESLARVAEAMDLTKAIWGEDDGRFDVVSSAWDAVDHAYGHIFGMECEEDAFGKK